MLNTREGWREVRVTVACKRPPGARTDPLKRERLGSRNLPVPTARLATAGLIDSARVGDVLKSLAARIGFDDGGELRL